MCYLTPVGASRPGLPKGSPGHRLCSVQSPALILAAGERLLHQLPAVVVAVGRADHGVHVERCRLIIAEEDPCVMVQFQDHNRALQPEIEGLLPLPAADPAEELSP